MLTAEGIKGYKLIDAGGGERLEQWGKHVLIRPEPVAMWERGDNPLWHKPAARYVRSDKGGGNWDFRTHISDFELESDGLRFMVKPMGFKHMGLFPEQLYNWRFIREKVSASHDVKLLNLFAYTGAASVYAAHAGASVCHVDSAKGIVAHARHNANINGITNIRYIVDDCLKFVQRESRRGNKYDAIIMDPPSYGRGPNGEIWKIDEHLFTFLRECATILSEEPVFVLINCYSTVLSVELLTLLCKKAFPELKVAVSEIGIPIGQSGFNLPCGISAYITKS